jgi:hypothetical protein
MKIIRFPSMLSMDQTALLAQGLKPCLDVRPEDRLTLDLTDLERVSAFGLAALGARTVWMIRNRRMSSGTVMRRPQNNRVGNDLVRMGLFKLLAEADDHVYRASDPFARPQELWLVDRPEDLKPDCDRLCKLLRTVIPADEDIFDRISGMMQALGHNVFRHAQSSSGAMLCGQVFPKNNIIEFAVADTGRGIPAALESVAGPMKDHAQAIVGALTAQVGQADGNTRLGSLAKLLATVKKNKGELVVLSGNSTVFFRGGELSASPNENFPGTVVGLRLVLQPRTQPEVELAPAGPLSPQ